MILVSNESYDCNWQLKWLHAIYFNKNVVEGLKYNDWRAFLEQWQFCCKLYFTVKFFIWICWLKSTLNGYYQNLTFYPPPPLLPKPFIPSLQFPVHPVQGDRRQINFWKGYEKRLHATNPFSPRRLPSSHKRLHDLSQVIKLIFAMSTLS